MLPDLKNVTKGMLHNRDSVHCLWNQSQLKCHSQKALEKKGIDPRTYEKDIKEIHQCQPECPVMNPTHYVFP